MNRPIKFRAWDGEQMHEVEIGLDGYVHAFIDNKATMIGAVEDGRILKQIPVMQFTGLFDQNDAPIYEGDLVEITIEPTDWNKEHFGITQSVKKLARVDWKKDDASFEPIFEPTKRMHPCYERMRFVDTDAMILGNIHENTELL